MMDNKKTILMTLLTGILAGFMHASGAMGMPIGAVFGILVTLPLFLLALSNGFVAGASASIIGLIVSYALFPDVFTALLYATTHGLPVIFISYLALSQKDGEFYPVWLMTIAVTLFYVAGFALYALITPHIADGVSLVEQMYASIMTEFNQLLNDHAYELEAFPPEMRAEFIRQWEMMIAEIVPLMPGIYMTSAMTLLIGNGWLAHIILKKKDKALRPSYDFDNMRLPHWMAALTIITTVIAWYAPKETFAYFLSVNSAVMLWLATTIEGLALLHGWAGRKGESEKKKTLVMIYIAFTMTFFMPLVFVALAALWNHVKRLTARIKSGT